MPIISVIFEKLIKNRIVDTLQGTMSHFQNGGMRGKGVVVHSLRYFRSCNVLRQTTLDHIL